MQRSLDMVVLDTIVLCGNGETNEDYIEQELRFLDGIGMQGPGSSGLSRRQAAAEVQWAWLERELMESKADYLWVAGHYPIWSAGNDGSQPCLIERLRPLLQAHGAHYISGHDHMLEHFEDGDVNTFVVGAGKECCYPPVNLGSTKKGAIRYMLAGNLGSLSMPPVPFPVQGGFASMVFGAESVAVELHAHDGTVLYAAPRIARRVKSSDGMWFGKAVATGSDDTMLASLLTPRFAAAAAVVAVAASAASVTSAIFVLRRMSRCDWQVRASAPLLLEQ
mmetsp:Transcript_172591/g.547999  ORF Transcript_172591/g.547999 Transcript_172591/m.547999 type:complete len:278 (-) Transcript_172591:223-1056(-)